MAQYETSTYAQMRRCRMAHLRGEMIDECFEDRTDAAVRGYVHAVRPDLISWPLRWTITIESHPVTRAAVTDQAMALAG